MFLENIFKNYTRFKNELAPAKINHRTNGIQVIERIERETEKSQIFFRKFYQSPEQTHDVIIISVTAAGWGGSFTDQKFSSKMGGCGNGRE